MTINYLKRFFLLNLILSILITFLISEPGIIRGIEHMIFLIASAGFIVSFFIKENVFARYLKIIFFNALIFSFSLLLVFMTFAFVFDSQVGKSFHLYHFFFLIFPISLYGLCNFFGGLAGIIPKGIIERLKVSK